MIKHSPLGSSNQRLFLVRHYGLEPYSRVLRAMAEPCREFLAVQNVTNVTYFQAF
jgi:hypothetical protein